MLKKILTNKIVLICCGILVAGIVIYLVSNQEDSKVDQKENHQIEQDDAGLEVKEHVDGTVDSVDGSGSWDDTADNNEQKTETTPGNSEQKTETTPDNDAQQTDDTENNNNNNNSNNNTADDRDEIDKQENILEDDKEWSGIS